ncbi:D-lactate dehydrogenase [Burkholderia sp. Ax-1719]|uniref:D-lactate dehydrogenase n=1 Tax=Burkholderia sp. Ax-1719 TaxID=2608334 RepID=UPI0014210AED|nr:D-lactate dehydrogenase [Burkholderia sp. Ax-1719]NIE66858.1 D-lactate dehydrogenase [Burkholderia sp. Ax-1719]
MEVIQDKSQGRAARDLLQSLRVIAGERNVLTGERGTRRYTNGFRFGGGLALAVVRPGSLVEMWRTLVTCVQHNAIVITQASNTGLTGGSTPHGNDYGRDVVVINTTRIRGLHLLSGGEQVVCLAGTTLDQLERALKPLGREPHSVIGSSCIGASVIGGVCNNSGGSLVRRGPAYTELALYAQVDATGRVHLVNHLGIELGSSPEETLRRLERGAFSEHDLIGANRVASDHTYADHVRDVDADTPARYNADPLRLREASGSAGKLMVFAVRLDTFVAEKATSVFYIGTNETRYLTDVRRHMLTNSSELPIAGEYLHRDAYDMAAKYGKDMFVAIERLGTRRLPSLFAAKNWFDSALGRLGFSNEGVSDRILQWISYLLPNHLPERMQDFRERYEHHLMIKVSGSAADEVRTYLEATRGSADADYFECTRIEASKAFLHRFVAASAAVRYRAVHRRRVEDIVALDIALRRNDRQWLEHLPPELDKNFVLKLYYGHFFCHVFHQDYIVKKGGDCLELEHELLDICDKRGAKYPAEHNVGHLYKAEAGLAAFYQELDPCNCMNPGIGQTSKFANYREPSEREAVVA